MFNKVSFLVFALTLLVLTSCQSRSVKNCFELNWREKGESLALNGKRKAENLKQLELRCKRMVSRSEVENFLEGFQRGLAKLCSTQNGYDFGYQGQIYEKTCPKFKESPFLKGYYKGRLEYLTERLKKIESLYQSSEERVWRKEREYTIIQSQDPERAKFEADVLESYREEARSLAQLSVTLKQKILKTKKLSAESFF